jgi:hypothetical protein
MYLRISDACGDGLERGNEIAGSQMASLNIFFLGL